MEKWSEKNIKNQIDQLIEESFIISLNDIELKKHLENFISSCELVFFEIKADIENEQMFGKIKSSFDQIRSIINNECIFYDSDDDISKRTRSLISEQIVQYKLSIYNFLNEINPELSEKIIRKLKSSGINLKEDRNLRLTKLISTVCYLVLLFNIGILLWFIFL